MVLMGNVPSVPSKKVKGEPVHRKERSAHAEVAKTQEARFYTSTGRPDVKQAQNSKSFQFNVLTEQCSLQRL
jgi:hypothetical protein